MGSSFKNSNASVFLLESNFYDPRTDLFPEPIAPNCFLFVRFEHIVNFCYSFFHIIPIQRKSRTAKSCQSSKALWTDRLSENCPVTVRQSGVSNTIQGNCNHPDRRIILDKKQHLQPYIRPISPPRRRRTGPRPTGGIPSETSPEPLLMTGSGIRGASSQHVRPWKFIQGHFVAVPPTSRG